MFIGILKMPNTKLPTEIGRAFQTLAALQKAVYGQFGFQGAKLKIQKTFVFCTHQGITGKTGTALPWL